MVSLSMWEWVPRVHRHVIDCGLAESRMGLYDARLGDDNFLYSAVEIMNNHVGIKGVETASRLEYLVMVFRSRRKRFVAKYPCLSFYIDTQRFLTICVVETKLFFVEQKLLKHNEFSNGILIYLLSNLPDELGDELASEVKAFLGLRKSIFSHKLIRDYLCGDEK